VNSDDSGMIREIKYFLWLRASGIVHGSACNKQNRVHSATGGFPKLIASA